MQLGATTQGIEELEERIGYTFQDKSLLQEAFTHISYAHVYNAKSNERLEYLGDTVLQLIVTEWQYQQDKTANEGQLTRQRQKLVCKDALDSAVDGLGVWEYLLAVGTQYNIKGKAKANQTHYDVGKKVRQTIDDLGGTMPEDLPTAESIKTIEAKQQKEIKN